jgi:lipopolysaccharide/colanic/teichoic acid biosynthesis glycosyltransferase
MGQINYLSGRRFWKGWAPGPAGGSLEAAYPGLSGHAFESNSKAGAGASSPGDRILKRIADLFLAVFILPFVVLVGLPIAILIVLDGGNPFFRHNRIGHRGAMFGCLKFRSMQMDAQARLDALLRDDPAARGEWERARKLRDDPRVTPVGRFLRKTSLDELPQIWNVIRGDMSFVGPRPVTNDELVRYKEDAPLYLSCKPGITGLWQITGRNDAEYDHRVALDAKYARSQSFLLDLRILVMTVPAVLSGRGAY